MRWLNKAFLSGYVLIGILFLISGLMLVVFSVLELWHVFSAVNTLSSRQRFTTILEGIGLLTIAMAALELGQMVLEEEVMRLAHMSGPTRVRRFISRFLVVIIVSLTIESLVAVFRFVHDDPTMLPQVALVIIAAAILLVAWGIFIKLNRSAEELEPEAMAETKKEDKSIEEKEKG